jgi:(2R)-3-sulfolactate dehydrogenase (NADP+)
MSRMSLAEAQTAAAAVLVANRTDPANARSVAKALVLAQADGLGGHGLMRLATYAAQAQCGKVDGFAKPVLIEGPGAVLKIDAANGFAYPAIDLAIEHLPALARAQGIAAAAITRSGHCGAMGLTVERIAQQGLIALMLANTPAAMAAWGGRKPLLGTNPIACAFPRNAAPPVVIDLSLSTTARGQIVAAKQKGAQIPEGWAVDADGKPTTDPGAALAGTLLPLGGTKSGAKGAALALMVEALAAGLTGSRFAHEASSFLDAKGPPPGTGQLLIALNPSAFGGSTAHIESLFAAVSAEDGARLPGDRRLANRRKAEAEGLEIDDAVFQVSAN